MASNIYKFVPAVQRCNRVSGMMLEDSCFFGDKGSARGESYGRLADLAGVSAECDCEDREKIERWEKKC